MIVKCYRDLLVWQKAMCLVEEVYKISSGLPRNEENGIKAQIRRAAVSIPSNIAEGHSRQHTKEFLNHLSIALGSVAELETQLELRRRLNLSSENKVSTCIAQCGEVGRMVHGLLLSIRRRFDPSQTPSP